MDAADGRLVVQVAVDAASKALEYVDDPELLAISVVILTEDGDGNVHAVTHVWPQPDPS